MLVLMRSIQRREDSSEHVCLVLPHAAAPCCRCTCRLQTLNEYIQDTEDLVNLKLDQHRNQLIGIDLILTAFTSSVAIMTAVAGYFGMNLNSGWQEAPVLFNLVTVVSVCSALMLFVLFVGWLWFRQMLVF